MLLALAPALRLNVFSSYESFELRRFSMGLFITAVIALLIFVTLLKWSRRGLPWVFGVASVIMLCLFNWPSFNTVGEFTSGVLGELLGHAVIPVALAAGLIGLAIRLSSEPTFHVVLLLASLAIVGSQSRLVLQRPAEVSTEISPEFDHAPTPPPVLPDIYLIVLDGYAREDILSTQLGFDNTEFLGFLDDRGFHVPRNARSNYDSTFASLSSMFGMTFILQPGFVGTTEIANARGLLRGGGPAVDFLKAAGYEFHYVESPWGISACGPSVDVCHPYWTIPETARWLTEFTIFAALTEVGSWTVSTDHSLSQFDTLEDLATSTAGSPRLIYAHIGIPHPPFLLDAQCNRWDNPKPGAWRTEISPDQYLDQILCVNHQVRGLIEAIDRTNHDTVVVFTADHSVALNDQWSIPPGKWNLEQVQEKTAILSAYRLPTNCSVATNTDFQVVNTFRLVIDCLFNESLGAQPERYFHADLPVAGSPMITEFGGLSP